MPSLLILVIFLQQRPWSNELYHIKNTSIKEGAFVVDSWISQKARILFVMNLVVFQDSNTCFLIITHQQHKYNSFYIIKLLTVTIDILYRLC